MKIFGIVSLVLALALAGCGTTPVVPDVPAGVTPVLEQKPLATAAAGAAGAAVVAAADVEAVRMLQAQPTITAADSQDLVEKAMQDLIKRAASPDLVPEINLVEVTQVVWGDTSLGCPSPDISSAQVLTPGYLIILKSMDKQFEYHADMKEKLVYCENPMPPVAGLNSMIEKARQDLAQRISAPLTAIKVLSASEVTWPDGSLGCPRPDIMVVQVPVPGYKIVLESSGKQYSYHAAKDEILVYCENPAPSDPVLDRMIEMVSQDLASRHSIKVSDLMLLETTEVVWPDAGLGCPQPDMLYAPVETPGFIIKLRSMDGLFEYHTDKVQNMVLCNNPPASSVPGMEPEVEKARQDLAARISVPAGEINLVEASQVIWSDASAGCPQPDMMYAQVLTPGYLIVLTSGDRLYEYHAGSDRVFKYCSDPLPPASGKPD